MSGIYNKVIFAVTISFELITAIDFLLDDQDIFSFAPEILSCLDSPTFIVQKDFQRRADKDKARK